MKRWIFIWLAFLMFIYFNSILTEPLELTEEELPEITEIIDKPGDE